MLFLKTLIIVESPSKIKTIKKIVGSDYEVMASFGHIRDLDDSFGGLGVDTQNGYAPFYTVIKEKKSKIKNSNAVNFKSKDHIVKEIKAKAKTCDMVLLASDPDREGEAIAWHLKEVLRHKNVKRIVFNEITPKAVKAAIDNPRDINIELFYAQQARRILDRLMGFTLSPVLWKKIAKGLSVGRVQSPALRMIAEREKEIVVFVPEEYYDVFASVNCKGKPYVVKLEKTEGSKDRVSKADEAEKIKEFTNDNWYSKGKVSLDKKQVKKKPGGPFTTALLQKTCNNMLGWTADRAMRTAQNLYESGFITYMRTDSVRFADEAMDMIEDTIKQKYGKQYYHRNVYSNDNKKNIQDAHEAIRPTDLKRDDIDDGSRSDVNILYKMIWNRTVASQMSPAVLNETVVKIKVGKYEYSAKGAVVEFDGFSRVWKIDDVEMLPEISLDINDNKLESIDVKQKFTKAPPRFSEAKLVDSLEKEGVGRPSTYAAIIEVLLRRNYVAREGTGKSAVLKATQLGIEVSDFLGKSFDKYVSTSFTSQMEYDLDSIEQGNAVWNDVLDKYYPALKNEVKSVLGNVEHVGRVCPECGNDLVYKIGKYGKFISCSGYPKCKRMEKIEGAPAGNTAIGEKCPTCGSELVVKKGKFGEFVACTSYPRCKYTADLPSKDNSGRYKKKAQAMSGEKCERCGSALVERFSKKTRKKFWGCSKYPTCDYIYTKK